MSESRHVILNDKNSPRVKAALENLVQLRGEKYAEISLLLLSGKRLIVNMRMLNIHESHIDMQENFLIATMTALASAYFPEAETEAEQDAIMERLFADVVMLDELMMADGEDVVRKGTH